MTDSSPSVPGADAGVRSVAPSERVELVDVLRGFALCGVFIANAYIHHSGQSLLPRERLEALKDSPLDVAAERVFEVLISGKAMAIFSFLFGLGFAIQMGRAELRGESIVPVYARRLGVLLLMGLTHLFAFWYGDVLYLYALVGFVLLLFRKLPDRTLLLWGLSLILGAPLLVSATLKLVPLLASSPEVVEEAGREAAAKMVEIKSRTLAALESGSFLASRWANVDFYLNLFLKPMFVSYALVVLGRFLLGLLAGRRRLFHEVERHLPFFRRLLVWGLTLSLLGIGTGQLVGYLSRAGVLPKGGTWRFVMPMVWEAGVLGLASFYVASLSLLFQRPGWRRRLSVLAPVGRMALTNYLGQTVICMWLFQGYGLGLIGKLGPAACMSLIFGLFWAQVWMSHLWLARFRFGPAEWLWRSLTYGKLQPMSRGLAHAGEGGVVNITSPTR